MLKFKDYEKILEDNKEEAYFTTILQIVEDLNNYSSYKYILTDIEKEALITNLSYFWNKYEFYENTLFDLLTLCLDEGIYTAIDYRDFKKQLEEKM